MNDNLDTIFYNPDHTKTYNPSGKPTGVVMTDFDIMEAKQAIEDLYAKKLKAFAEEVSELFVDQPIVQTRKPTHGNCCTCQTCGEYHDDCQCGEIEEKNEWKAAVRQALKAIKEKAGIE